MLYRISVVECGLTGIANIFRSRLSGLDDLLRAGTVPLTKQRKIKHCAICISAELRRRPPLPPSALSRPVTHRFSS